jgi:putative transcriptional regulator
LRKWLKEMRLQRKLTQNDIAEKANIERSYYTMIESGARTPSVPVAKAIGETIGFNWTIFFDNYSNEVKQSDNSKVSTS